MNLKLQLKILSFLQFCLWGSWLTTLGSYMFVTLKFDGASIGAVYSSLGIAAVFMPTLLGIVADKWLSAKWLYMLCHLVGAGTLLNLMERLRIALLEQRSIGKQFRLDLEAGLESLVYPEDTAPYYAGEMISVWKLPVIERKAPYGKEGNDNVKQLCPGTCFEAQR